MARREVGTPFGRARQPVSYVLWRMAALLGLALPQQKTRSYYRVIFQIETTSEAASIAPHVPYVDARVSVASAGPRGPSSRVLPAQGVDVSQPGGRRGWLRDRGGEVTIRGSG